MYCSNVAMSVVLSIPLLLVADGSHHALRQRRLKSSTVGKSVSDDVTNRRQVVG